MKSDIMKLLVVRWPTCINYQRSWILTELLKLTDSTLIIPVLV